MQPGGQSTNPYAQGDPTIGPMPVAGVANPDFAKVIYRPTPRLLMLNALTLGLYGYIMFYFVLRDLKQTSATGIGGKIYGAVAFPAVFFYAVGFVLVVMGRIVLADPSPEEIETWALLFSAEFCVGGILVFLMMFTWIFQLLTPWWITLTFRRSSVTRPPISGWLGLWIILLTIPLLFLTNFISFSFTIPFVPDRQVSLRILRLASGLVISTVFLWRINESMNTLWRFYGVPPEGGNASAFPLQAMRSDMLAVSAVGLEPGVAGPQVTMTRTISCGSCGKKVDVREPLGSQHTCRHCAAVFTVE